MLTIIESFISDIESGRMGKNPHQNANLRSRLYYFRDRCLKCECCNKNSCPFIQKIEKAITDVLESCDKCKSD